jgi:MoaA/NifB/PqqE/SkfB family radical SAM enzyme
MQYDTHSFIVVATGLDWHSEDFESRFYDAGCDDAGVSVVGGAILVDFARKAASLDEAVETALRDIARAGATVVRVHR